MILLGLLLALGSDVAVEPSVGFSGVALAHSWNRVGVLVRTPTGGVEGELRISVLGSRCATQTHRRSLRHIAGMQKRYDWTVFLSGREQEVLAEVIDRSGRLLAHERIRIRYADERPVRVLALGAGLDSLRRAAWDLEVAIVPAESRDLPAELPPLLGLDAIAVGEPAALDADQEQALEAWLESGGLLIFSTGRLGAIPPGSLWQRCSPMEVAGSEAVSVPDPDGRAVNVPLVRGKIRNARILRSLGSFPAVVRGPHFRGEVVFLAFPADQAGLDGLIPETALWSEILRIPLTPEEDRPRLRVLDTAAQLSFMAFPAPAEERFRAHIGWSVIAIAAYVIVIGPVDYFRLRRKGRLRRGWISFGFCTAGLSAAVAFGLPIPISADGHAVHLALADPDLVQTFTALRAETSTGVTLASEGAISCLSLPWQSPDWEAMDPPVTEPPATLRLEMPARSRHMAASCRRVRPGELEVACRWNEAARRIELHNTGSTSLTDCLLLTDKSCFSLGDLPAGAERTIEPRPAPLLGWLKGLDPESPEPGFPAIPGEQHHCRLTVHEMLAPSSYIRRQIGQRRLDLTADLRRGDMIFLGRFDRDLTGVSVKGGVTTEVRGLFRMVVPR